MKSKDMLDTMCGLHLLYGVVAGFKSGYWSKPLMTNYNKNCIRTQVFSFLIMYLYLINP